jgi:hypothetical protein
VKKNRTNILIIGTLASGSSALVDMLREYENINVLPREFDNFRRPGFVADQLSDRTSMDYPNVIDKNVKFVNNKWKFFYQSGLWNYFFSPHFRSIWEKDWGKLEKYKKCLITLKQIDLLKKLSEKLNSDASYDEKIQFSNEWIQEIGNIYSSSYDFTLFNQALFPWIDLDIWTRVFEPFKLICVYRDPKDQLAEMIRRDIAFSPFRNTQLSYGQFNIMSIYGNDRKGRLKFLTDALKNRIETIDHWQKKLNPDQFMLIDFDGMVINYDDYKAEIEKFLGINEENHRDKKMHLNPDVALQNSIGIYKQYLTEDEVRNLSGLEDWYNQKIRGRKHALVNGAQNLKTGSY